MSLTCWNAELAEAMLTHGETLDDLVATTLTEEEAARMFDPGFGSVQGDPFTAWTTHRVYFPVGYDGAESVGSVPRNPCDEETQHVGG